MKNCWDIKGCPASHYIGCPAYEKQIDCWEIREGCLCNIYSTCDQCPIYVKHKDEADNPEGKS